MARHIHLLGALSITDDDRPCELLSSAKGCALLTYLLVRGRPETREHLADLLWDAPDTASSLRNLRVLLTRIRPYLPGLEITRRTLRYQPRPDELVDHLALTASLGQRHAHPSLADLRLYRGELLEGFYLGDAPRFMEWLTLERERLRRAVLDALHSLCQALASAKRWQEGAEAAAHWLSIESLDEEALRWRMQFLAASGQAALATQAFEAYRKLLWDELGAEPEPATQALLQELAERGAGITAISLPDLGPFEALRSRELPEPGPLPATTMLPYHRNDDFVGREAQLLQIAAALGEASRQARPAPVAITGIGGLGKTQAAVEFCYRYGRYFPGGVFWLNFAEAEQVAREVAAVGSERGLGLFREAEELTLADQVGRVQRAWQEPVPRLLIFDNCEDEARLATWLPVTGGCRVVLTSRHGAWDPALGVAAVPLSLFSPNESSRLLQRLAPHVSEAEAREIAQEVGHLPLALYLAGSFLRRYRQISPGAYLAQVRARGLLQHPSLQGHGASRSPTGHELSVARTYALNWEQLNPADEVDSLARQLLACAACLAPGEPIPAEWLKAAVCGDGDDILATILAEDGVSRLIAMGFLMREPGGLLVLHPLLALATREMIGKAETERAQIIVATTMAHTISAHRHREGHLSTLPLSASHLRHVSDAIIARKTPVSATLASLLGSHLESIGSVVEAERILRRACAMAEEVGDALVQAQALTALASTQEVLGEEAASLQSASRAIALYKAAGGADLAGLTQALYYEGWAHYQLGQSEAALRSAEDGCALSQAAGLPQARALFFNLMGVVNYYTLCNYDIAQRYLEESLVAHRESGNRQGESAVLNNMGENALLQGRYAVAAQYYEEALALAREIKSNSKANIYLSNLCGARIRMGQFEAAAPELETLIAQTRHHWYGLSEAYRFLGEAYLGQRKAAQALTMAQQALALAHRANSLEHGRAWRLLGLIAAQLGRPVRSRLEGDQLYDSSSCFRRSLDCFNAGGAERDRAITLWYWARHELSQGRETRGLALWQEAQALFARLRLPFMESPPAADWQAHAGLLL